MLLMPRAVLCIACNCIVRPDGRPFCEGLRFRPFFVSRCRRLWRQIVSRSVSGECVFEENASARCEWWSAVAVKTCFDFWSVVDAIIIASATLLTPSRVRWRDLCDLHAEPFFFIHVNSRDARGKCLGLFFSAEPLVRFVSCLFSLHVEKKKRKDKRRTRSLA